MKILILLTLLVVSFGCNAQKRGKTFYNVDTVKVYDNCKVIIFRNKHHKIRRKTLSLTSTKYAIDINRHVVFNIYPGEKLKYRNKNK